MKDLNKVKNVFDEFVNVQRKYSHLGAWDSEPDGVFQGVISNLCKGKNIKFPTTQQQWQLYAHPDSDLAAFALTITLQKVCEIVKNSSDEVKNYVFRTYCWRYDYFT